MLTCHKIVGYMITIVELASIIFEATSRNLIVTKISSVIKDGLVIHNLLSFLRLMFIH
jgi:hypothetical protein